jgi:prephenate dehydrogenase
MDCVVIVGVGLIGGSFARAIRAHGFQGRILGVSSAVTLRAALDAGVIDEGLPLEEAVPRGDLILLAQPISRILETLGRLDAHLRQGALITDVGSTKREIVRVAAASIRRGVFLGGHPMAGKESRGVEHADAALFKGRTWFLTPGKASDLDGSPMKEFAAWVRGIGAKTAVVDAARHDHLVSLSSHLPQMLSTALAATLDESLGVEDARVAGGPGLHDMTRLAMSSYEIWRDVISTNPDCILDSLNAFLDRLQSMRDQLLRDGGAGEALMKTLGSEFEIAGEFAKALRKIHT